MEDWHVQGLARMVWGGTLEGRHVGDLARAQLALSLSVGVELVVRIWVHSRKFWTVFGKLWVQFWSILDSGPNVDPGPGAVRLPHSPCVDSTQRQVCWRAGGDRPRGKV